MTYKVINHGTRWLFTWKPIKVYGKRIWLWYKVTQLSILDTPNFLTILKPIIEKAEREYIDAETAATNIIVKVIKKPID